MTVGFELLFGTLKCNIFRVSGGLAPWTSTRALPRPTGGGLKALQDSQLSRAKSKVSSGGGGNFLPVRLGYNRKKLCLFRKSSFAKVIHNEAPLLSAGYAWECLSRADRRFI